MSASMELFPHQIQGVNFAIANKYSINAFEMGLGKTLIAITMADKLGGRCLCVVPAFLKQNWLNEIDKFSLDPDNFEVISYAAMSKLDNLFGYDMVVFDEAHYLKNIDAKRTKQAHFLILQGLPKYMLAMSGTPIKNNPSEIWSLLKLTSYGHEIDDFDKYKNNYWRFRAKFCDVKATAYGEKVVGMKNAPILGSMVAPVYNRLKTEDAIELPETINITVKGKEDTKTQDGLEACWVNYLAGSFAENKNFSQTKVASALGKADFTIEYAGNILQNTNKVIIFTDHILPAEHISARIKGSYLCTGKVPVAKRAQIAHDFERDESAVMVATIGSMSTGFNFTSCNQMIFNDVPWVPADLQQAQKRIHRIGQKKKCFYHFIYSSDVDETIIKTLTKKNTMIKEFDRVSRGTEVRDG